MDTIAVPTRRQQIATACSAAAVVCALIAPIPLIGPLTSTEFASDFENGTHTADYSGVVAAQWIAVATIVFAVVAVALDDARARTIGALILVAPAMLVLAGALGQIM
ncbi:hypothetical protein [Williamsia deligens]|uniref:TrbC/VIRB2 family protein n=1 Tax=Williamsia deligens TaxID=321325 RepID=A0ABW3G8T0_9NOCA|nr:hypothetical protein [Williamsia deligens]MCP2192740.1 hypothetical protein [Williamsia deligens]